MPTAPVITESPKIDRFLSGLIESNVLDGGRVRSAWDAYRAESHSGDIADLAEFLIRRGLMTEYQAERALAIAAGLISEAPSTVPMAQLPFNSQPRNDPAPSASSAALDNTSQIFHSSDGLVDFDVPPDRHSAETPASHRPITAGAPAPESGRANAADPGSSILELLLPEGVAVRTLSIPFSRPAPVGPKFAAPPPASKKNWVLPPAPVTWAAATPLQSGRIERPPVVIPRVPQFSSSLVRGIKKQVQFWKPVADTVQLTIFGAPEIEPGQRVNFLVYAHAPEAYSNVAILCRALRPDAELLGAGYLDSPVPRGVEIGIHMALAYAGVAKSLVQITWIGQTQPKTFEVFVPWESPPGLASGVVTAGVGNTMIASLPLHFVILNRQG